MHNTDIGKSAGSSPAFVKEKYMTYPFDDEALTYNYEEHRYVLKKEYVLDKTGIDLSRVLNPGYSSEPQKLANQFLDELSSEIYNWIYEHNANNLYQEFVMAKSPDFRVYLKRAMLEQVLYVLRNGDLRQYSGINLKTGQIIDPKLLKIKSISPNTQSELDKIIPGYGIAITYQGTIIVPANIEYRSDY